ncbi:hypothetical protein HDU91_002489, partial [Kappamyces sp. JEL0680]
MSRKLPTLVQILRQNETKFDLNQWSRAKNKTSRSSWIEPATYFRSMFLPVGYPKSVHPAYTKTHLFQFGESFCGSVISVLGSEALLSSLGATTTPVSAGTGAIAINWVLKDGFGELGKLVFIQRYSYLFDTYPKTAKLLGEFLSVGGAMLQMLTLLWPSHFLILGSLAIAFRGIHYSIWSATHTVFNQYTGSNMGDLISKDDAQLSLAHLLGLGVGVCLLGCSNRPAFLFACFAVLGASQVLLTYLFVKAARFEVLNLSRLRIIAQHYSDTGDMLSYAELVGLGKEHWLGESIRDQSLPEIVFAPSLDALLDEQTGSTVQLLQEEFYLLSYPRQGRPVVRVCLKEGAASTDVVKAVFHATR